MNQSRSGDSLLVPVKTSAAKGKKHSCEKSKRSPMPRKLVFHPVVQEKSYIPATKSFRDAEDHKQPLSKGLISQFYHKSKEGKNSCKVHSREQTRR